MVAQEPGRRPQHPLPHLTLVPAPLIVVSPLGNGGRGNTLAHATNLRNFRNLFYSTNWNFLLDLLLFFNLLQRQFGRGRGSILFFYFGRRGFGCGSFGEHFLDSLLLHQRRRSSFALTSSAIIRRPMLMLLFLFLLLF